MPAIRDEEYAAVAERERPLMVATAYLLTGDPVQAERVVQRVLAELYGRWSKVTQPRLDGIRAVVHTVRAPVHLPWENRQRVELIDGPAPIPTGDPIVADLGTLTYDQRAVIVLECYAGLAIEEIAQILNGHLDDVRVLARQAQIILTAGHPGRSSDETLNQELTDAVPHDLRESQGSSADDLAHGRELSRRRWIQRSSAALAAVVLVVAAAILFAPRAAQTPHAAPSAPIATASSQGCDPSSATCRSQILLRWRSRMVEVASSHLDPTGKYFSGFGYAYDSRYDTPGFWTGQGGALAFEMFRLDKGATEVYLQIATSRKFAVRCGATTHQQCLRFFFMDGNSYLVTDSRLADSGIEVQYSPKGDEVITVVAHNTQRGKMLDISTGDLINLVQDDRLRLPKRCCYRR
jgi:DNA-directed RNA polymerase specialized sigma24 family protein